MKPIIVNINFLGDELQDVGKISRVIEEVQAGLSGNTMNDSSGMPSRETIQPYPLPQKKGFWLNQLNEDQLHFLGVFIHCEGKIKDVEKALGVSYPTVKAKLSDLKSAMSPSPAPKATSPINPHSTLHKSEELPEKSSPSLTLDILEKLNSGTIDVNQAIQQLKQTQKGES